MTRIIFMGFGNVGFHLCSALHKIDHVSVNQIYSRNSITLASELKSIPTTHKLSEIEDADVYIIAIPDDAIAHFSETLPFKNKLVVHTSGSVAMNALSEKNRRGVFYPLQTFSKNRNVSFKEIPFCLETENASDLAILKSLASTLSETVVEINSEERAKLHLAAVFVNNFVNHIYSISHDYLLDNNISFDLLKPLIAETAAKIQSLPPSEVQTGPAKRNDKNTIEKHLHLLEDGPYSQLYKELTKAIVEKYKTETEDDTRKEL
ncbi:Rossmann-like and DUF2520 domain-containing protein [Ulvibacter antarcticus]|uniref:Putative short-subunit dehydrogenase-like oxidoreductase (DUF2520 family) n=1 Tax=Ulvibacter antarcticus TaxID=442714 RepID=A0A3L9YUZ7_9FLAO|nr:DUF2520 domain-containing protein [Ulvibacter antarcticus]RMA64571.1 putative short-subunit dehydrogenase-like oxidoreductase (DUF2520 family) [Ulvibacter antarcticus]